MRAMSIFLNHDGRVLAPTARTLWDRFIGMEDGIRQVESPFNGADNTTSYETCRKAAETQGALLFEELLSAHRESIRRERKKGLQGFVGRRRAIERLGLPQVRAHRLGKLAVEERVWSAELAARELALPELTAIFLVRIVPEERMA
jgi:hypothetical protein